MSNWSWNSEKSATASFISAAGENAVTSRQDLQAAANSAVYFDDTALIQGVQNHFDPMPTALQERNYSLNVSQSDSVTCVDRVSITIQTTWRVENVKNCKSCKFYYISVLIVFHNFSQFSLEIEVSHGFVYDIG